MTPDVIMMQVIINYAHLLLYDMFTIFQEAKCIWIAI